MQMGRVGENLNIDFVISTGDNFYENGLKGVSDQQFEQSFSDIYTAQSLQKPWYLGKEPIFSCHFCGLRSCFQYGDVVYVNF